MQTLERAFSWPSSQSPSRPALRVPGQGRRAEAWQATPGGWALGGGQGAYPLALGRAAAQGTPSLWLWPWLFSLRR